MLKTSPTSDKLTTCRHLASAIRTQMNKLKRNSTVLNLVDVRRRRTLGRMLWHLSQISADYQYLLHIDSDAAAVQLRCQGVR